MVDHPTVALSKLIFWYDASRIQTWPSFLAQILPGEVIPSVTEIGRRFSSERMTDPDHLADYDYVRNFPGLEVIAGRFVLRGVGFLENCEGGYRLSSDACALAEAYREDANGKEWIRLLAQIILSREPRTRAFLRYLSMPDARMQFSKPAWFSGSLQPVRIEARRGDLIYPFDELGTNLPNLRTLLNEYPWWALGAWRDSPLLNNARDCTLVGQRKPEFSLHRIGQALRAPCEVLLHLGVLTYEEGECRLDPIKAAGELGAGLAEDFGWQPGERAERSIPELLNALLPDLRSPTGYVVASELRRAMEDHGIENPDRSIAQQEAAGTIIIEAESYGQGRHGEGLYGDPRKQLLKIRVHN